MDTPLDMALLPVLEQVPSVLELDLLVPVLVPLSLVNTLDLGPTMP